MTGRIAAVLAAVTLVFAACSGGEAEPIDLTGGDPVVRKRLEQFNADAEAGDLPDDFEGHTPYGDTGDDLRDFMQEALAIYEKR